MDQPSESSIPAFVPADTSSKESTTLRSLSSSTTSTVTLPAEENILHDDLDVGSVRYTRRDYWEKRFAEEDTYEWLGGWKDPVIKDTIESIFQSIIPLPYTKEHLRILLLGTGNSPLPLDMAKDGYKHIYATDYSETVIHRMQEKFGNTYPNITWEVQDMMCLSYPTTMTKSGGHCGDTETVLSPPFDIVLDKAAMDALIAVGGDVWDPPVQLLEQTYKVCEQVARVLYRSTLQPSSSFSAASSISSPTKVPRLRNGLYLQLSFGQPHFRQKHLLQDAQRTLPSSVEASVIQSGSSAERFVPTKTVSTVAKDDDEWEPDKNPHIQPFVPVTKAYSLDRTFWKAYNFFNIPIEFGYYLYVMEVKDS